MKVMSGDSRPKADGTGWSKFEITVCDEDVPQSVRELPPVAKFVVYSDLAELLVLMESVKRGVLTAADAIPRINELRPKLIEAGVPWPS